MANINLDIYLLFWVLGTTLHALISVYLLIYFNTKLDVNKLWDVVDTLQRAGAWAGAWAGSQMFISYEILRSVSVWHAKMASLVTAAFKLIDELGHRFVRNTDPENK